MENNIVLQKPLIEMGAEKLRESLHLLIDSADERFLRMIAALGSAYANEEQDDFWGELDKSQRNEVISELEQGEKDIGEGKVYTIEEAREMVKKW